jgi:fatty-acyl-CoA synthase
MARRDQDGYYYLADRKSNMIISGGENVYPSEVEQVFGAHPKVKDLAVIGVPHEKWGEAVHAVVVLHQDKGASESELLDWCKDRIAGYKRQNQSRSLMKTRCRELRPESFCTECSGAGTVGTKRLAL